jgi:hypothetical protein
VAANLSLGNSVFGLWSGPTVASGIVTGVRSRGRNCWVRQEARLSQGPGLQFYNGWLHQDVAYFRKLAVLPPRAKPPVT